METTYSIKNIDLNVGFGCQIMVEIKGVGSRIKSRLIGVDPKSYIIIKTPNIVGIQNFLIEGTPIIVRYLYLGKVCGFCSSILGNVIVPQKVIFLSYPKSIEKVNLRKHERIICALPVTFGFKELNFKGIISDLSTGGCRLNSKIDIKKDGILFQLGDPIVMSFVQLGVESNVVLNGIIRNLNYSNIEVNLGIEFDRTQTEALAKINSYIKLVKNT